MEQIKALIIDLNRKKKTASVKSYETGKISEFDICFKYDWMLEDVQRGDDAIIVKDKIVDYSCCNDFNYSLHNQEQESYENMICDPDGKPYEF